jgi:peptidoglycan-N-acetylglucosamine deacetylase
MWPSLQTATMYDMRSDDELSAITRARVRGGAVKQQIALQLAGARSAMDPTSPTVALTFDDGPDPTFTSAVLDTLAALAAPATFFVVAARAERYPEIVRRVLAEGHAIGSHSISHPDPWRLGLRGIANEYRGGALSLRAMTGLPMRLFRPPHGYLDVGHAALIRAMRLEPWLWSRDTGDWIPGATVESIMAALGSPVAGDVIVMHDAVEQPTAPGATNRSATINALPAIVDRIRGQGLRLVRLPDRRH